MSAVHHIAFLKFKPGTPEVKAAEIISELGRLPRLIGGIRDFSIGANNSPQGLNQGYTHAFTMIFESAAARDAYLVHPAHLAFERLALPHVAAVAVVDYSPE
ncbi:MAG: Dabb family protein [Verrucomicrobiae bacterium]|nr:Dabb family protein [Verrucomicrobiae bacterium]